jgi:eukaryotic-like serine/threonine-protein kinase
MPSVGDVLAGRYRVAARLGSGGMATVFRARDVRLDRDVAIKVLLPNMALDPAVAARFDREARALASAAHPSIVGVFDVEPGDVEAGLEPFYVMELCDGGSLADRLATDGRLPPTEVATIIGSVADGLANLHGRGVIHRDVKPHNILFSGGRAKLADFGLARGGEATDLTSAGTTMGTLAWLAPELLAGRPASSASDTYALAVAAFQCLTGRLPGPAGSVRDVVESSTRPAPRVSEVAPDLGVAFDGPVAAGLSKNPADRSSPRALADGLRAGAARPPVHAVLERDVDELADTVTSLSIPAEPARPAGGVRARGSRGAPRPGYVALALAGLLLLGLMFAASALRQSDRNSPSGSPRSSAVASVPVSPSAPPTPAPSPTVSPTPTALPTPTPNPAAAALAALDRVDAAIVELAGPGGLKNRELNDLRRRAAELRAELDDGRFEAAAGDADRLASRVEDLEDEADEALIDALRDAVAYLVAVIPPA